MVHRGGGGVTDFPTNAKLCKMQQNTDRLVQLIGAATPNVPNQTPMPQPSKQLLARRSPGWGGETVAK